MTTQRSLKKSSGTTMRPHVGQIRPVDVPVLRCPVCATPYSLKLPVYIFSNKHTEWLYVSECKHKVESSAATFEGMEFARLGAARIRKARS